jgi:hypothetical protein
MPFFIFVFQWEEAVIYLTRGRDWGHGERRCLRMTTMQGFAAWEKRAFTGGSLAFAILSARKTVCNHFAGSAEKTERAAGGQECAIDDCNDIIAMHGKYYD